MWFGLKHGYQRQFDALRKALDECMVCIDEFAAPFAYLIIGPKSSIGMHTTADIARGLIDRRGQAAIG